MITGVVVTVGSAVTVIVCYGVACFVGLSIDLADTFDSNEDDEDEG